MLPSTWVRFVVLGLGVLGLLLVVWGLTQSTYTARCRRIGTSDRNDMERPHACRGCCNAIVRL